VTQWWLRSERTCTTDAPDLGEQDGYRRGESSMAAASADEVAPLTGTAAGMAPTTPDPVTESAPPHRGTR